MIFAKVTLSVIISCIVICFPHHLLPFFHFLFKRKKPTYFRSELCALNLVIPYCCCQIVDYLHHHMYVGIIIVAAVNCNKIYQIGKL